ncbi:MAG: hypothetical protein FJ271_29460 [Planctomycetes bacterium]|nr:hypothetical protein [Planctomycetota bacterium]
MVGLQESTAGVKSIEQVEKSGKWKCRRNSGIPINQLRGWFRRGLLERGRDWRKVRVIVPRSGPTGNQTWSLTFVRVARLRELVPVFKTVEEVERSGRWVLGTRNPFGIPDHNLHCWRRNNGCPYVRGRRIKSKVVMIGGEEFNNSPRECYFFERRQLEAIAPLWEKRERPHANYSSNGGNKTRALWEASQDFEDSEGRWMLPKEAWVRLGISQVLLGIWTNKGCPYKDGKTLRTKRRKVGGIKTRYYLESEIDAVKERKDNAPRRHEFGVSLAEAARRTTISPTLLKLDKSCREIGLTKQVGVRLRARNGRLSGASSPTFIEEEIACIEEHMRRAGITRLRMTAAMTKIIRELLNNLRKDGGGDGRKYARRGSVNEEPETYRVIEEGLRKRIDGTNERLDRLLADRQAENHHAPRLPLAIRDGQCFVNGQHVVIDMTPERRRESLLFLAALTADWKSTADITNEVANLREFTRFDRLLDLLPDSIKAVIESSTRKGYRLTLT